MDEAANPSFTHDQIATRARQLWLDHGQPGGRDLEHWFEAERQLREEAAGQARVGLHGRQESNEAERRLDGLMHQPPSPARRTPKGEQL